MTTLARFADILNTSDPIASLRAGLIGHDAFIEGPWGRKKMLYADYVASGRALRQIEDFVLTELLPFYANSHTEASFVGGTMTRLRREARDVIRTCCGASADHAVIFTGSGATQGINRLVHLFDIRGQAARGVRPLVLLGPYEHHSNILPWRDSGAEVITLPEDPGQGPCRAALGALLAGNPDRPIVVALSAASNVTGHLTDIQAVTRQCKAAGARIIWDYAGGGPYLPINLSPAPDAQIDAVVLSAHKFVGGPQASGVLILRKDAVAAVTPTYPGGGTVRFVSPTGHDYSQSIEAREEAGTPNVIGDLRAALCMMVKDAIGEDTIAARNAENCAKALAVWQAHPMVQILGRTDCLRLPIFSFRIRDGQGGFVHQQLVTRMLSDHFGIQARGGCACAGPYVHSLLDIDAETSAAMRNSILAGYEIEKPGFTRLNLSFLASAAEVDYVLRAVTELAEKATDWERAYDVDPATAIFRPEKDARLRFEQAAE